MTGRVADYTAFIETNHKRRDFLCWVKSLMVTRGDLMAARAYFEANFPKSRSLETIKALPVGAMVSKAAVAPGTTTDSAWAAPLAQLDAMGEAFVALIRPKTVLGRLSGVRPVPFRIKFPRQTGGTVANWVGQGRPIGVSKMALESDELLHSKLASICVVTDELARSSNPQALRLIENDLSASLIEASDVSFLDPTRTADPDISPASITYGADHLTSTGSSAAQVEADLKALFAKVTTALSAPYLVMRPSTAIYLATLRSSGQRVFPNIGALGGDIWGVPVLISASMPTVTAGSPAVTSSYIVLIDAAEIFLADDGIELDTSSHAAIELQDVATNPPVAATVFTSLWQMNLTGVRAIRFVNWERARDGAVAYIDGVTY